MNKEYWHQKWQSKDIGFNQIQPNKLMQRYFSSLKLAAGSHVFVPLCGQSVDMLWLAKQEYQVTGVELSPIACDAFFKEHKMHVTITESNDFVLYKSDGITLFCGDFFKINRAIVGKIDTVYDRAALIALPKNVRTFYADHLIQLMTPATTMFLITTAYHQSEMEGPPFSVDENEVAALYGARFDIRNLYRKSFDIPPRFQAKGLLQAAEHVYLLKQASWNE